MSIRNELEAQTLANIRNTLLPKLVSGELRVNNKMHDIEMTT